MGKQGAGHMAYTWGRWKNDTNLSIWVWIMSHPCLIIFARSSFASYRASPEPHELPALEAPTHAEARHLANPTWFQWLLLFDVICLDFTALKCNAATATSCPQKVMTWLKLVCFQPGCTAGQVGVPGVEDPPVEGLKVVYSTLMIIDDHWWSLMYIDHHWSIFFQTHQIFELEKSTD